MDHFEEIERKLEAKAAELEAKSSSSKALSASLQGAAQEQKEKLTKLRETKMAMAADLDMMRKKLASVEQHAKAKQRSVQETRAEAASARSVISSSDNFIVIGDVGGTSSRLELIAADAPRGIQPEAVFKKTYRSGTHSSLRHLLESFRADALCTLPPTPPDATPGGIILYSLSVCGPVTNGKTILLAPCFGETGWAIDQTDVGESLESRVVMLNDFHSVGLSLSLITPENLHTIYEGASGNTNSTIACLGPGSGLGEVYGVWVNGDSGAADGGVATGAYQICCSEGGMSEFIARNPLEWSLIEWLRPKVGLVACCSLLCGVCCSIRNEREPRRS
jgi:glucokinase